MDFLESVSRVVEDRPLIPTFFFSPSEKAGLVSRERFARREGSPFFLSFRLFQRKRGIRRWHPCDRMATDYAISVDPLAVEEKFNEAGKRIVARDKTAAASMRETDSGFSFSHRDKCRTFCNCCARTRARQNEHVAFGTRITSDRSIVC